jgi:acetolactate synthase I/II/III large subunit
VDVVCVVGSRLGDWTTNGWTVPLAGSEALIQIDRDPWLVGCNYPVTLGIVADAAAALSAITRALPLDVARPLVRTQGIRRLHAEQRGSNAVPLDPARVMAALQDAFPDAFYTADIGEHCAHALHHLTIDRPDQFRTMVGLASMGSGIGMAIGARHARTDRPVLGICGDGGFMMHAGEVLTCVEHGIDVVLVVMNDGRYNMINHGFQKVFGRVPGMLPARAANLAGVARELGALGACIRTPDDLDPRALRKLAERGRPLVLDVRIDPSTSLSAATRSASLQRVAFGGAQ